MRKSAIDQKLTKKIKIDHFALFLIQVWIVQNKTVPLQHQRLTLNVKL